MRRRLQRGSLRPNRNSRSATISWILAAVLAVSGGCGYHVVGRTNTLPSGAHTIAVPAFVNRTTTYRVEQILTQAVVREFIARTSYRVVPEPDGADLLLHGEVTNIASGAVLFDPTTGRATTVLVTVNVRIALQDHAGKIFSRIITSSSASRTKSPWTSLRSFRKKARHSIGCPGISRRNLYPTFLRISDAPDFRRIADGTTDERQDSARAAAPREGRLFARCFPGASDRGID